MLYFHLWNINVLAVRQYGQKDGIMMTNELTNELTNKEAIEYNKNLREYMIITDKRLKYKFLKEHYEALDKAINALEKIEKIQEIVNIDNSVIQEDVMKYKMICEVIAYENDK